MKKIIILGIFVAAVMIPSVTHAAVFNLSKTGTAKGVVTGVVRVGNDTVTSPLLTCGTDCTAASVTQTSVVTISLTATAATGSIFTGWSGPCSGTSSLCSFVMSGNTNVFAMFSSSTATSTATTTPTTATAFLASASEDKAGLTFGPGAGNVNKNPADWKWSLNLTLGSPKTISSMEVRHNCCGEAWSTYNNAYYPLVVYKNGTQLNTSYGMSLGSYPVGTTALSLYGQVEANFWYGGVLTIKFSDGSQIPVNIPSSSIRQNAAFLLSVYKQGTGLGTVTGSGINCGSTCSTTVVAGTPVSLSAAAFAGSIFTGWSGPCSGTSSLCSFVMSGNTNVFAMFSSSTATSTATTTKPDLRIIDVQFAPASPFVGQQVTTSITIADYDQNVVIPFQVNSQGIGQTVSSIAAGEQRTLVFPNNFSFSAPGTSNLSFMVDSGSVIAESNENNNVFTRSITVQATSTATTTAFLLSVYKQGTGLGTVTGSGINCGSTCSTTVVAGTPVSLSAAAFAGSIFTGWSGPCSGTSSLCSFVMSGNTNVFAMFSSSTATSTATTTLSSAASSKTVLAIAQLVTRGIIAFDKLDMALEIANVFEAFRFR